MNEYKVRIELNNRKDLRTTMTVIAQSPWEAQEKVTNFLREKYRGTDIFFGIIWVK